MGSSGGSHGNLDIFRGALSCRGEHLPVSRTSRLVRLPPSGVRVHPLVVDEQAKVALVPVQPGVRHLFILGGHW